MSGMASAKCTHRAAAPPRPTPPSCAARLGGAIGRRRWATCPAAWARQRHPGFGRNSSGGCRRGARGPARAAAERDDPDLAVFRFTLGIPGFDDALVPRVVGVAAAALLLLNHLLDPSTVSDAQTRAEALGVALAAVAVVTPSLQAQLSDLEPGRGRGAAADSLPGAASLFALRSDLPDAAKQELAWGSYALLRNTNSCGVVAFWRGRAVLCRGLVGAAALLPAPGASQSGSQGGSQSDSKAAAGDAALAALGADYPAAAAAAAAAAASSSSGGQEGLYGAVQLQGGLYCPDRLAMGRAGADAWRLVPEGAQALLLQPLQPFPTTSSSSSSGSGSSSSSSTSSSSSGKDSNSSSGSSSAAGGFLVLLCERPRALSSKERAWAEALAAKLHAALAKVS